MRRRCGGRSLAVVCVLATACATSPSEPRSRSGPMPGGRLAAGVAALAAGDYERANAHLTEAARRYPPLEDYTLYFRARAAARAQRFAAGLEATRSLLEGHPDSVWVHSATLLTGELHRSAGDLASARDWLDAARSNWEPGCGSWARATVQLAEVEAERGDAAKAVELASDVRRTCPRHLTDRRARRLIERVRTEHPDVGTVDPLSEAELLLREGDAAGAREQVTLALAGDLSPSEHARALWARAQAERSLGDRNAAEDTCRQLARQHADDPLAPRALLTVAIWHWNADDDAGALALFRETAHRFPESPQAAEAG